jgi:hypothetical protein
MYEIFVVCFNLTSLQPRIIVLISEQQTPYVLSFNENERYNEYSIQVIIAACLFGLLAGSYEI